MTYDVSCIDKMLYFQNKLLQFQFINLQNLVWENS